MSTTENTEARERGKAPAGERIADWADGRLGIYSLAKANMRKIFPDHWSFMLGEVCMYSFLIIILTGVYLTLFFHPSMNEVEYHAVTSRSRDSSCRRRSARRCTSPSTCAAVC